MRILIRKTLRKFLIGNAIEKPELLLAQVDVLAKIEMRKLWSQFGSQQLRCLASPLIRTGPDAQAIDTGALVSG